MRMYDIIDKKRLGEELTDDEIRFFVNAYTKGDIPDYQASALLMAVCCRGMNTRECAALTSAMRDSGDVIDLSALPHTADKHSTGGVGDKTTLIVAPLAAAMGLTVAKMSGRGLGHTGGTVDKLESIPGYRTSLTEEEFLAQAERVGVVVIGQSADLTPADKKLYALRDVTATVSSVPLIASSIMSKKLAAGAESIVLDVKYGSGAFMKTPEEAENLARAMTDIGAKHGKNVAALITDMDKPLGHAVGNVLEVKEALRVLRGEIGEGEELYTLCVSLAAEMHSLSFGTDPNHSLALAKETLDGGRAYAKFLEWISAQGGDVRVIENNILAAAPHSRIVTAEKDAYITHINAQKVGECAAALGAGRINKTDTPDLTAGLTLAKNTGDFVRAGEEIAVLFSSDEAKLDAAAEIFAQALEFGRNKPAPMPLIWKTVRGAENKR